MRIIRVFGFVATLLLMTGSAAFADPFGDYQITFDGVGLSGVYTPPGGGTPVDIGLPFISPGDLYVFTDFSGTVRYVLHFMCNCFANEYETGDGTLLDQIAKFNPYLWESRIIFPEQIFPDGSIGWRFGIDVDFYPPYPDLPVDFNFYENPVPATFIVGRVPEPSALLLLATAVCLGALKLARRRYSV